MVTAAQFLTRTIGPEMTEATHQLEAYDAVGDAARFAAPLKAWANIGFLRGFSGMRGAMIPEGQVSLPSAVFSEIAHSHLDDDGAAPDEIERRKTYIQSVTSILTSKQSLYIDEHYRRTIQGHAVDFASAAIFVTVIIGLILEYGPYHPLALVLIGMIGVKMIFLSFSVRRMVKIAQSTFKRETHAIRLPWQTA
jgi:hypothetical protein